MASLKEAYESTIGESFTGLKLLIWAIPLYICRSFYIEQNSIMLTIFGGVFALLLIGFLTESAHNVIEKKPELVPGINVLSMAFTGIKTLLALAIPTAVTIALGNLLLSFIQIPDKTLMMTVQIFIWMFLTAFPVTVYLVFIRRLSFFDTLNLKKVSLGYGDAFITVSYLIIKLYLIALVIIGFITYMFWLFVGLDNALINYIWCIAVMYNLVIATNYLAKLSEELYSFTEKDDKKD